MVGHKKSFHTPVKLNKGNNSKNRLEHRYQNQGERPYFIRTVCRAASSYSFGIPCRKLPNQKIFVTLANPARLRQISYSPSLGRNNFIQGYQIYNVDGNKDTAITT